MTIPTRQQVINQILITKHMLRQLKTVIDSINVDIRLHERKARLLSESKFNRHLVSELKMLIKHTTEVRADFINMRKEQALILSCWITQYDLYQSNGHEKAQLLGICDISFNLFLKCEYSGDGSLYQSAMLHCETFGEKGHLMGDQCKRNNPMRDAVQLKVIHDLKKKSKLRKEEGLFASDQFDDVGFHKNLKLQNFKLTLVKSKTSFMVAR